MSDLETAMIGGVVVACLIACVQFAKFWRLTRDRFFLWFVAAFAVIGASFAIREFTHDVNEQAYYAYVPRLVGFLFIAFAILDKNRRSRD
ncbi:MAG: DUF5985 family protein [Kofleriaceae bacterium]